VAIDNNRLLKAAIAVAQRARDEGNHPFGAVLASVDGEILLDAGNTVITDRDATGHAETNLVRLASHTYVDDVLADCTLYSSAEPCAMCAGAIYWSGIGRVVYALSELDLLDLTGADAENPTMTLGVRDVLAAGQRAITVEGPFELAGATAVHDGFWNPARNTKTADQRGG